MNIWTFSDIHQECLENAFDPALAAPADFDVVVVAGDVDIPLSKSLDWLWNRFAGARIVYIPGNHDFWRGDNDRYSYQDVVAKGRERAAMWGIDLLVEGESCVIDGVRFVGGTLWTDMAVRPQWMPLAGAMSEANKRMNDYHRIRWMGNRSKYRLEPRDTIWMHRQTRSRIEAILAEPHDGPTVVVTHHAPHPKSLGCDPLLFDVPQAYASDLSTMMAIAKPELWVHGHLHGQADYVIGETRILMNSRGHTCEPSVKVFDPAKVVQVGRMECSLVAGV